MRSGRRIIVLLAWLAGAAGCGRAPPDDPPTLRFSAIPDQPAAAVLQQHRALMERVCAAIKRPCQWVETDSYEGLVDRFGRGEVDIAYLGAVTFVQARHRHKAVPLAMRDIDFRFTSVIVVPKTSKARSLQDLRQVRFSFANRNSTSGHFMLRQRLLDQQIVPETYFASVAFTADHDSTLRAVAAGQADAGGVNASVFYKRVAAGDPAATELRVVWQTPPYVDYVWGARKSLSEPLRQGLIDALLDLDLSTEADRPALRAEGAAGYVPAFPADFEEMHDVLRTQGRL
jgi:phosphonate transport system substrate-binding protein